jgi:ribosomal-protein-alanine N-acetyltransferase
VIYAPERIETARLVLRRPRLEDADSIFYRYASDSDVARYLAWPRHQSIDDTLQFLKMSDADWSRGPVGPYLIESRATGGLLGSTGLMVPTLKSAVTGYVLARDAWGRGYATEALRAMIELATDLSVREVRALCHPDNAASVHVLEKGGFHRGGTVKELFPNLNPNTPLDCWRFIRLLGS